jgi:hypothetical protein
MFNVSCGTVEADSEADAVLYAMRDGLSVSPDESAQAPAAPAEETCPPTDPCPPTAPNAGDAPAPAQEPSVPSVPDTAVDPAEPKRVKLRSKWRDFNCKMKGEECYRLAQFGDRLVWIDEHPDAVDVARGMLAKGIRASERKCANIVEVPVGTLVVTIHKNGTTSYDAGRVEEHPAMPGEGRLSNDCKHVGVRRVVGGYVHVLEIDGRRVEYRSAT